MDRKNLSISRQWLSKLFFEVNERTGATERNMIRGRKSGRMDLTAQERKERSEQDRGDHY